MICLNRAVCLPLCLSRSLRFAFSGIETGETASPVAVELAGLLEGRQAPLLHAASAIPPPRPTTPRGHASARIALPQNGAVGRAGMSEATKAFQVLHSWPCVRPQMTWNTRA